ncbi:MAG: AAA family ATPase, partial [Actinomycetota bacterium]|nr:AAA family ATPase [Actinomycetota bacterium]
MSQTATGAAADERAGAFGGRFRAVRRLKSGPTGETLLGTDLTDGSRVVIRTVSGPDTPAGKARMERELTALGRMPGPVGGVLGVGREGGFQYFVMPFVPGVSLEERLAAGPLTLREALTVGRSVIESLATAHGHGVLHRDVRPSNVIVAPTTGALVTATLIDYGVAHLARVHGSMPESWLRTARYASPEAAGLVSHEVDERSDLYSTGAVLFECLAGRPLFGAESVGEVLRQHVTEAVPPLRGLGVAVPGALDEVVQRLLMKDPADRYTSARAVLADLDQILVALDSDLAAPAVVVGALDHRRTLTQPAFVGRDAELAAIEDDIQRARTGDGGLVLVEAESGGGKTKLLDELAQRGAEQGIWVLRGQGADQMAQRPLRVLDGVVDEVMKRARADATFVPAMRHAMGPQLQSVVDALPRLAGILGSTAGGSLGPEAYGEARSLPALTAFLDALGTAGPAVLIVLDDCQWADELTVKLVGHWQTHPSTGSGMRRVVLLAAFRTEEVPAGHALRRTRPSTHVVLPPLADDEMRRVLASMAGPLPDEAVRVVERLSEGNPFMATAVLRGLVETGALIEEPAGWRVHPAAMADVQTSRHAAAFLSRRLALLPAEARRLLSVGALLGKEFDAGLAASLADQSTHQVETAVEEARRRHILWSTDGDCVFVHDKIREALLDELAEDDRRALHLAAATAFEADELDRVFELAYHFDAAGETARALPYALAAADRARSQHALEVAERHYRVALHGAVAAPPGDVAAPGVHRRAAEGLGDILMLRGHYGEAARQLQVAAGLTETDVGRAEIEGKLGELAFKQGDVETASEAVERAVRLLGRRMPRRPAGYLVSAVWEIVVQALHTMVPRLFVARRSTEGAEAELLAIRLYSRLAYIYWFQRGRIPCLWAHLREMNLAERYPPTSEEAQAYSEHAPVMTMIPWFSRGLKYARKSLVIRTGLGDVWGQGQSLHFLGVVLYAASRYQDCIDSCREAVTLLDRTGDCWESNTAKWHIAFSLYRLGDLTGAVD